MIKNVKLLSKAYRISSIYFAIVVLPISLKDHFYRVLKLPIVSRRLGNKLGQPSLKQCMVQNMLCVFEQLLKLKQSFPMQSFKA